MDLDTTKPCNMPLKYFIWFSACCGILGTVALTLYFSAPFWLLPLPAANASAEDLVNFGRQYRNLILFDVWLQQVGSILTVLFALALVHLAGTSRSYSGRLVLLVGAVILSLSLAEGTFIMAAVQAGDNGHNEAVVTSVDMGSVFIHIFLLAPSLFLVLGFALMRSSVLPAIFRRSAIVLGILFQVLGVAGLFSSTALVLVIFVLMAQNAWTLLASISLLIRRG
ncbi:MAG: hypothetical protein C5B59_15505 [Bacteroidetes bacterium]|nr:MAG: hypothetical protein C5B59_15505 [Bacteroidota bacterium]